MWSQVSEVAGCFQCSQLLKQHLGSLQNGGGIASCEHVGKATDSCTLRAAGEGGVGKGKFITLSIFMAYSEVK